MSIRGFYNKLNKLGQYKTKFNSHLGFAQLSSACIAIFSAGWRFLPCLLWPVLVEEMFCEHKIDIPMFVMVILKRTYQKVIVFFLNQTQKQPSTFWLLSIKMAILSFITEIQYTYQENFFDLVAYSWLKKWWLVLKNILIKAKEVVMTFT